MKEIYFIRHGQTDYNKKMIIQGSGINSDLNEKGRWQADQFFQAYRHIDFELVITSKLKRSQQTVQQFVDMGIPLISTADLNEIGWGVHEGLGGDPKLRDTYRWLIGQWSSGNLEARVEQGESAAELIERCNRFIKTLPSLDQKNILVCTHGRTLRCLVALLKGESMDRMETYEHANTGLYKFYLDDDGFKSIVENDSNHLL